MFDAPNNIYQKSHNKLHNSRHKSSLPTSRSLQLLLLPNNLQSNLQVPVIDLFFFKWSQRDHYNKMWHQEYTISDV